MKQTPGLFKITVQFCAFAAMGLLAVQYANAQIYSIATSGRNVYVTPAAGGNSSELVGLNGFGFGVAYSSGDIFVSQSGNTGAGGDGANGQDILEYNATTGAQVSGFSVLNLNDPQYMTVDGSMLFVANRTNSTGATGSIGAYNTTTGVGGTLISNLYQPTDVVAANGDLYVSLNNGGGSGANGSIEEFNELTGSQIMSFNITGLSEPQGLAIDNGNLYVTNEGTNQVLEYSLTNGSALGSVTVGTNPSGITTLASGNLLVSSNGPGTQTYELNPNLGVLSTGYLTGANSTYTLGLAAVTPEPSSWALFLAGFTLLVFLVRRQQYRL